MLKDGSLDAKVRALIPLIYLLAFSWILVFFHRPTPFVANSVVFASIHRQTILP